MFLFEFLHFLDPLDVVFYSSCQLKYVRLFRQAVSQVIEHRLPRPVVQLCLENYQHTVLVAQAISKIAHHLADGGIIAFITIFARLSHFLQPCPAVGFGFPRSGVPLTGLVSAEY